MTEWISGVNIPSCQLMIGMGVPLHRLPDIRRLFGKDPWGTTTIDFDNDPQIPPSGAATLLPTLTCTLLPVRDACLQPCELFTCPVSSRTVDIKMCSALGGILSCICA